MSLDSRGSSDHLANKGYVVGDRIENVDRTEWTFQSYYCKSVSLLGIYARVFALQGWLQHEEEKRFEVDEDFRNNLELEITEDQPITFGQLIEHPHLCPRNVGFVWKVGDPDRAFYWDETGRFHLIESRPFLIKGRQYPIETAHDLDEYAFNTSIGPFADGFAALDDQLHQAANNYTPPIKNPALVWCGMIPGVEKYEEFPVTIRDAHDWQRIYDCLIQARERLTEERNKCEEPEQAEDLDTEIRIIDHLLHGEIDSTYGVDADKFKVRPLPKTS